MGKSCRFRRTNLRVSYAVQLANAVAASYVTYIGQLEGGYARAAVSALKHESSLLTEQIDDLQTQIDTVSSRIAVEGTASSAGQQDTVLLGSLKSEQNQVSLQLNGITSQITNAQLSEWLNCQYDTHPAEGHYPARFQVQLANRSRHYRVHPRTAG